MQLFFRDKWEVEGLQTVGILLVVCSSLKLMHFLGLIDLSVAGKRHAGTSREFVKMFMITGVMVGWGGVWGGLNCLSGEEEAAQAGVCIPVFVRVKH